MKSANYEEISRISSEYQGNRAAPGVYHRRERNAQEAQKKAPEDRHRKWHSKYSSTSEDSELESLSDTENSDSTEEETTEDETDSSQESIDEKYFKTDKYKPRPTKTRNSSVSKVCTLD